MRASPFTQPVRPEAAERATLVAGPGLVTSKRPAPAGNRSQGTACVEREPSHAGARGPGRAKPGQEDQGIGALGWAGSGRAGNTVVATMVTEASFSLKTDFKLAVTVGVVSQGRLVPLLPAPAALAIGPGAVAF